jgi:hypothetical protein
MDMNFKHDLNHRGRCSALDDFIFISKVDL